VALSILTSPSRLILLPTGPGQTKDLTRPGLTYLGGGWFPDGRRVAFIAEAQGARRTYGQDLDGGEHAPSVLRKRPSSRPTAVHWWCARREGYFEAIEGGEPDPSGLRAGRVARHWSRDGRSLFLTRFQDLSIQVHRLDTLTADESSCSISAPRTPPASPLSGLAVSADGRSYAYSFIRNLSELYLIEGLR